MSALLDAARAYAQAGWAIFPCEPRGKRPLGRLAPRGLHDATTDVACIETWWRKEPAANIAVAAGAAGLVVLDIDGEEGESSYGRLLGTHGPPGSRCAPDGATVRTPGGGWHLYLAAPAGVALRPSASRIAPGIDVRAGASYVVLPPSIHPDGGCYAWCDELPASDLPALAPTWVALLAPSPAGARVQRAPGPPVDAASRYGRTAAQRELQRLEVAPEGQRNHTLNEISFALGQLVAGGELPEGPVRALLEEAGASIGLGAAEVARTVASGLSAGLREPRSAPPRERWAA